MKLPSGRYQIDYRDQNGVRHRESFDREKQARAAPEISSFKWFLKGKVAKSHFFAPQVRTGPEPPGGLWQGSWPLGPSARLLPFSTQ